jgi:hypothetical protein
MVAARVSSGTGRLELLFHLGVVIAERRIIAPTALMRAIMLSTILLVVLILLLLGAIPSWPYSRGWGYGPSGILGVVLIVVLVLALSGRV